MESAKYGKGRVTKEGEKEVGLERGWKCGEVI